MNTRQSPKDPIFYLHHGMVDKLWQDWEDKPNTTSTYVKTSMPRYNGTHTFKRANASKYDFGFGLRFGLALLILG
jgi:hypothetical protein